MMSHRTRRVTQRIIIGLILSLSVGMAGFTATAEGASLFDLKKELYDAETELKEKEFQLRNLEPLFVSGELQNNLDNDRGLLPQIQQRETDTAAMLQSVTNTLATGAHAPQMRPQFEQRKRDLEAELPRIREQKRALEASIRMQEERIARVPILQRRVPELQKRIAELRPQIPVAEARFSEFMNCYQFALSMKAFNKFTRTGVVLNPSQMEDEHGSSPRKLVANKYYEVYLKHYKTDFNDANYTRLNQAIRDNLAKIGEQFFNSAQRTVEGRRSSGYVAESAIQSGQEQIAGFRNQYSTLLSEGEPVCDRMRNFVTQGETVMWDSSQHGVSLTQAPFTRRVTPDFSVPGLPSESVTIP